jgi:hypothetical protein
MTGAVAISTSPVSSGLTAQSSAGPGNKPGQQHERNKTDRNDARALAGSCRQVQADMPTHLIHRPARDIVPLLGGARVSFYPRSKVISSFGYALAGSALS